MRVVKLSIKDKYFLNLCEELLKFYNKPISFLTEIEGNNYEKIYNNLNEQLKRTTSDNSPGIKAREQKKEELRKMRNQLSEHAKQGKAK
jgi:hypothetical protein